LVLEWAKRNGGEADAQFMAISAILLVGQFVER
jgi:hypothetical protein